MTMHMFNACSFTILLWFAGLTYEADGSNSCSQTFTDPPKNFSGSEDANDNTVKLCFYSFQVAENKKVQLKFESGTDRSDYRIILFNGLDCLKGAKYLYDYEGTDTFVSESNKFGALFIGHEYKPVSFSGTFEEAKAAQDGAAKTPKNGNAPPDQSAYDEFKKKYLAPCGSTFDSNSGEISLAKSIDASRSHAFCVWRVTPKSKEPFVLYDISFKPNEVKQELWILEGSDCSGPILLHKSLSYNTNVDKLAPTNKPLTIIFSGDGIKDPNMFSAKFDLASAITTTTTTTEAIITTTTTTEGQTPSNTTTPGHGIRNALMNTPLILFGLIAGSVFQD